MGVSQSTASRRSPPPLQSSYPLDYYGNLMNPIPIPAPHYHGNSSSSYTSSLYLCNRALPHVAQASFPPIESPPPPCGEHKPAKVVNSDVNVHKDSLTLEIDEMNPDHFLVSFVFDALLDGCFTIYFFAREETDRRVVPLFPEIYVPIKVPFQKGLHQEFRQPPSTGIAWNYFAPHDLSSSSSRDDVFPIIISAETCSNPYLLDGRSYMMSNRLPQVQITMIILEKGQYGNFDAKVVRQLLWADDTCYELREIYGFGKAGPSSDDSDTGKECVVCMTEPKCIAVLPCRHMCMCSSCAKELRNQSNKCPICREIIESLLEIKMGNAHL